MSARCDSQDVLRNGLNQESRDLTAAALTSTSSLVPTPGGTQEERAMTSRWFTAAWSVSLCGHLHCIMTAGTSHIRPSFCCKKEWNFIWSHSPATRSTSQSANESRLHSVWTRFVSAVLRLGPLLFSIHRTKRVSINTKWLAVFFLKTGVEMKVMWTKESWSRKILSA